MQCAGEWDKLLSWWLFHSAGYCPPYRLEIVLKGETNNEYSINHDTCIALHIDLWIVLEGRIDNEYSLNKNTCIALHINCWIAFKGETNNEYSMNQSIAFDINKDIINKDKKNNQRFISYQNIGLQLT